ncbi:glutathione synthase [Parvularcula sp. LCG005]|uniref:glutathione synthase n=1 Tax=Parvularcula sp. LCG005 TaxID=3078805 RepID=UPI002943EE1B|nr:glutathione synthase [Parvularcula sp. LCG005]WOI54633.1 glutathione synthase [Parvularcula sp. LCG005]
MRALFIIDPLDSLKPYKDTSLDLMAEAQGRGYDVAFCEYTDIHAGSEGVLGTVQLIEFVKDIHTAMTMTPDLYRLEGPEIEDLSDFDVIFIRKDPPFDQAYLSLTLLLEPLEGDVLFVNSPSGVRAISEKLSALRFPDFIPETLVSYEPEVLRAFAGDHDKVVLKPCYYGSGKGVVVSSADDPDFETHVNNILQLEPFGPVIAQGFLPEVADGDARVMMLDGDFVGAVGRKPPEGDFRANIAVGGTEFHVDLTPRQEEIAAEIGDYLRQNGILYAGLDFIGDKLIEINVTSPTLIKELRKVGGPDVSAMIWDLLEEMA